jgi:8-oxo-dGTP diphosphatase
VNAAPTPHSRPVTEVAVGVLVRADGGVLLADRPSGKPYAGYWEFPGGKVEDGETVAQALARELDEELGVQVRASTPWVVMEYDYPHAYVRLHFRRVTEWTGTPRSVEGQQLRFVLPGHRAPAPLLPAAVPAMRWIQLPTVTGMSPQDHTTSATATKWLADVLGRGLRQVIWRAPLLVGEAREDAERACRALAQSHGARLLLPPGERAEAGERAPAGVGEPHMPACYLDAPALRAIVHRPAADWLGAGVTNAKDLARAVALGCDFAVLESADATDLLAAAPLPVYLPAVLGLENLRLAQAAGAHGLAVAIAN